MNNKPLIKKKLISFFMVLCFAFPMQSQNWCPPGAKWHYSWHAGGLGLNAMVTYDYTKDTSVAGQICNQIKGTFYGYWGTVDYTKPPSITPNFRTYYTYESNKVVFAFNGTNFDTIVNYKANIGDKWLQLSKGPSCRDWFPGPVIVKDTGHVVINNVNLRRITLTYSTNFGSSIPTNTISCTYTMIEKFGNITSIKTYADMFPVFCFQSASVNDNPETAFKCYQDNNFPLYEITPAACNNVLALSNQNTMNEGFEIYPNPNSGNFNISIPFSSRIIINNSIGQRVFEGQFDEAGEHKINLSNLQRGIYFVNVDTKNGKTNLKFIKE